MAPDIDKTRRYRRYEVAFDVEVTASDWDEVLEVSTQNVSRGGLFVRSQHTVEIGSRLRIKLRLPDGDTLKVDGEVVHVVTPDQATEEERPGFGVRFDERHAIDLSLLEALAASYTGGRHAYSLSETYIILPTVLRRREDQLPLERTASYQLIELGDLTKTAAEESPPLAPPPTDEELPTTTIEAALARLPAEEPLGAEPLTDFDDGPSISRALEGSREPEPTDSLDFEVNVNTREDNAAVSAAPVSGQCAFGIDFGTSYTSIAMLHEGRIQLLADDDDRTMIPTIVCYREDEPTLVGWQARDAAPMNARTTVTSPKRLLGRRYDDPSIGPHIGATAVETLAGPNGQVVLELFGEHLAIPQVCAEIFRELARIGAQASGVEVRDVVLAAPVSFGQTQLAALRRAAELADLNVLKIVDEPVASAVAYGRGRQTEIVAVYDFGGGTFDFTLLEIADHRFRVMARAGDGWLGGDDFDSAIAEEIANRFWQQTGIELRKRQVEWQQLLMLCEECKRRLSTTEDVELVAPKIVESSEGQVDLRMPLDRAELERICGPLVDRSIEVVQRCLAEASVSLEMIDEVVLTGGVTRMPLVRERAQEYFARELGMPINPEHAVVIGNSIYADHLAAGVKPEVKA